MMEINKVEEVSQDVCRANVRIVRFEKKLNNLLEITNSISINRGTTFCTHTTVESGRARMGENRKILLEIRICLFIGMSTVTNIHA